jgi:hypothetical protein
MKKIIKKIVFASALLFASHAFAQDNKDVKFIPDANSAPVVAAEDNGIKAMLQSGTFNGRKAFAVMFQNTSTTTKIISITWKILLDGEASSYHGSTEPFKLRPNQTINLESTQSTNAKPAFIMANGATLDSYRFLMKVHSTIPTE